jgi:hypothetical protein
VGRYVKNQRIGLGNTAIRIPVGDASERPESPDFGQIRFNTDLGKVEFYNGTVWGGVSKQGNVDIVVDTFTGNGSTSVYTMSKIISYPEDVLVFVGSIYQIPTTNYTVAGNDDITFTSNVPNGMSISIIHNLGSTEVS